ncbi:MAG: hypothetical protein CMP10_10885 [Zetaproteobacteria bacterium]|nr:hypothetical protein [Pseudobdellovibrionaceae bacterium]
MTMQASRYNLGLKIDKKCQKDTLWAQQKKAERFVWPHFIPIAGVLVVMCNQASMRQILSRFKNLK